MKLGFPKEPGHEKRVAITPEITKKLITLGFEVSIQSGLGHIIFPDSAYQDSGATIQSEPSHSLSNSDCIIKIQKPTQNTIKQLKKNTYHISLLDPFNNQALLNTFKDSGVKAISLEMIPRSTIAQKMDVLSSQASLAGYQAVITSAEKINKIFPMMMTPAGTISPLKVFVIGAGVAGLQAIATAKRLGARVEAFDTRPVVEEQVKSLGAKFVKIDLGETKQTENGYAKQLTPDQIKCQQDEIAKHCIQSDIVITTAQVFGKKAPLIIKKETVSQMKPNSIIVDMAVDSGGNVEGSKPDEEVVSNQVTIIGITNITNKVAEHASQMFASNIYNFLEHFWDKETKTLNLDPTDPIIKSCLLTAENMIIHESFKEEKKDDKKDDKKESEKEIQKEKN